MSDSTTAIRTQAHTSASSNRPSARKPGPLSTMRTHKAYIVTRQLRPTGVTSIMVTSCQRAEVTR